MTQAPPKPTRAQTTALQEAINKRQELDRAVQRIASELGEHEAQPLCQLKALVLHLGTEQALASLEEAKDVESRGGLLTNDGSRRRRTPGGVFFYLVRTKVRTPQVRKLFYARPKPKALPRKPEAKAKKPAHKPSGGASSPWKDRIRTLDQIGMKKGVTASVNITLIGRPGKIVDRGTYIVTTMRAPRSLHALPSDLPQPEPFPTVYTCYISKKQWAAIAETLRDPMERLIISGFPMLDPETSSIAVFAAKAATRRRQQQGVPAR